MLYFLKLKKELGIYTYRPLHWVHVLLLFAFRAALILYDIYSASITQLLQSTVPFVTLDIILHKGLDMVNNNSLLL